MKKQIISNSPEQTQSLAAKIGKHLKGGEVIELVSDLGGGKTTFVRGFVSGTGSQDHVSSPSFTVCNQYNTDKFVIYHYDFYRLPEAGLIEHELQYITDDDQAVVVIEWADVVKHVLPEYKLTINIKSTGDNSREIVLEYPESLSYLVEEI